MEVALTKCRKTAIVRRIAPKKNSWCFYSPFKDATPKNKKPVVPWDNRQTLFGSLVKGSETHWFLSVGMGGMAVRFEDL